METYEIVILVIVGIICVPPILGLIASLFYFKLGLFKGFCHDFLHWHTPDDSPKTYDAVNTHATCRHCKKHIMQDSQGNWFTWGDGRLG